MRRVIFQVVLVALLGATLGVPGTWAVDCSVTNDGRCLDVGYFSGQTLTSGAENMMPNLYSYSDPSTGTAGAWAFPGPSDPIYGTADGMAPGVAVQNFTNFINNILNGPNPLGCTITNPVPATDATTAGPNPNSGCWAWQRQVLGASFLVLTMTGGVYTDYPGSVGPPPDGPGNIFWNGSPSGVNVAQQEFPNWVLLMQRASAAGAIDWDKTLTMNGTHPDSSSVDYGHDVTLTMNSYSEVGQFIVVTNPDGTTYSVNRATGDVVGLFSPLNEFTSTDQNMQVSLGGIFDTAGNAVTAFTPGDDYNINMSLSNLGTAASQIVKLELRTPQYITNVSNDAAQAPYGQESGWSAAPNNVCIAGYPYAYVVNSAGVPVCQDNHWEWRFGYIPGGYPPINQQASFQVSSSAPPGSSICFQASTIRTFMANPFDPNNFSVSQIECIPVAGGTLRLPSVTALNGDIHAGGGLCGQSQTSGSIAGEPLAKSYGQYVVSASGAIGNFGSNGSSTSTSLALGKDGSYQNICRPDMFGDALANMGSEIWNPGGTYDLSSSTFTGQSAYYISGNATISGTVDHALTLVVNGTVTIDGDITVAGGTTASDLPSLGIIASGGINITPYSGATNAEVDAFMFSNGTINTCAEPTPGPPTPPACDDTLTIKGFMMANTIDLARLGPSANSGSQPADVVELNPALYLNPPPFFDDSTTSRQMQGLGEQPPLF